MKNYLPYLIIGALCLSFNIYAQQDTVQKWQHFGNDNGYTGFVTKEHIITKSNVNKLIRSWGLGCDDDMFSVISRTPAIYKNNLYLASAGGKLTSYNASTGDFNWEFGSANDGWAKQPSVSSDTIVYYLEGSWPSYLYAVNGTTGAMIWKAPRGFNLYFDDSNIITVDESSGQVFLMDQNPMTLYAIDRFSGNINWTFFEDNDSLNMPFLSHVPVSNNKAWVIEGRNGSNYHRLLEISTLDGSVAKSYPWVNYNDPSSIMVMDTMVAVAYDNADSSGVRIFSRNNLKQAYNFTFKSKVTGDLAYNPLKNVLYIPTNPSLYAYDLSTGSLQWKYTVPAYDAIYSPTVANGIIYFISNINMWAIDEDTKADLFHFDLGGSGYENTQVAVYNGRLYFSGNGNTCDFFCLGFTAPKTNQTISFDYLDPKTYGDADFDPGATASSSLPVSYQSSDLNIATISNGKIHITGIGNTSITASQSGDSAFKAAANVVVPLMVNKKTLTVTAENKSRSYGEENPEFTISYNGFANGEDKSVIDSYPIAFCAASVTSPEGQYDIVVSGGSDDHYEFYYIDGILTIQTATGVQVKNNSPLDIYPNPAKDRIYVRMPEGSTAMIQLFDPEGKVVFCQKAYIPGEGIDLSGLNPGFYLIRITNDMHISEQKLIIR